MSLATGRESKSRLQNRDVGRVAVALGVSGLPSTASVAPFAYL
jgi:hypothetical protein